MRKRSWAFVSISFFLSLFLLLSTLTACSSVIDNDPKNDEDPIDNPIDDPVDDPIDNPNEEPADQTVKVEDLTYFDKNPIEPIMDIKKLNIESFSTRVIKLEFASGVTLYASTAPGKPASLPSKTLDRKSVVEGNSV